MRHGFGFADASTQPQRTRLAFRIVDKNLDNYKDVDRLSQCAPILNEYGREIITFSWSNDWPNDRRVVLSVCSLRKRLYNASIIPIRVDDTPRLTPTEEGRDRSLWWAALSYLSIGMRNWVALALRCVSTVLPIHTRRVHGASGARVFVWSNFLRSC